MTLTEDRRTIRSVALPPSQAPGILPRSVRPPLPLGAALVVAAFAGVLLAWAYPSRGWWPLAFVGAALMLVTLIGRRAASAYLVAFVAGTSYYLVLVSWSSLYLGPVPWVALSVFESFFWGAGGILIALAYRWMPRAFPTPAGRIGLQPVVIAGLWVVREGVTNVWPYGGFAWGRVALSQSESPFATLVAWVGMAGLTFLCVWLSALAIECVRQAGIRPSTRVVLGVGAVALVLAVPAWPTPTSGTLTVGAVQGDGPAGYFEPHQQGDVQAAQVSATLGIVDRDVDVVLWPEGSADLDPLTVPSSAEQLDYLSTRMGAPFIVGAITQSGSRYYNSSLLWSRGRAVDQYDKKHPVPFGEYVPDRAFWRPFAPALIDLIGRDYTPGARSNVFTVGGVRAGISICFDIVDDQLSSDMMRGGAQVILAQTNNADFGRTDENVQQLAIARLRAIEAGRSIVNLSTVGTSQVIDPAGRTIDRIPAYRPGAMVTAVPLGTTTTPATLDSRGIEFLTGGLGLAGLLIAGLSGRSTRRRRP